MAVSTHRECPLHLRIFQLIIECMQICNYTLWETRADWIHRYRLGTHRHYRTGLFLGVIHHYYMLEYFTIQPCVSIAFLEQKKQIRAWQQTEACHIPSGGFYSIKIDSDSKYCVRILSSLYLIMFLILPLHEITVH